jgi:hypothetical protein
MGAGAFDLTQTKEPTWATGKTAAQSLNAGAFKWTAAQTASILNNEEFSYACWFYVDAASGTSASDYKKIFGAEGGTNSINRKFTCGQYPTVNGFHVSSWNGSSLINCCRIDDALPSYQWTHICYSYKKGTINIYINGVLRKTTELTMNNSSYSAETPVIWNYTGRRIQDVRVYDHALSQKEVVELAKGMMLHIPMYAGYPGIGTNIAKSTSATPVAYSIGQYYTRMQYDTNFYGLKAGDTFTFGFKVTAPADRGIYARVQYYTDGDHRTSVSNSNTIPAGTTGYTYLTSTISSSQRGYTQMELLITSANNSLTTSATCYVSEVKLERGSVRTPWSPDASSSQFTSDYSIKDCSGYQVPIGTTGTVPSVTGDSPRYGMSASFDGAGACLWPVPDPIKSTTTEFTISVWFKTTTTSGNQCIWNGRSSSSSGRTAVGIFLINSTIRVDDSTETSSATISANTWYHLAVTWKSGGNKIVYLNGVQKTSVAAGNLTKSNTKASIGRSSVADSLTQNYFSGQMSDFRIYATALTADQVKELYNAPISVANTGACLSEQFTEGAAGISFAKTGVVSCKGISSLPGKYDPEVLIEPDGSCWAHIGHHADPTTYKFSSGDPFATGVWKDGRRFLDASYCDLVDKWEFIATQRATASADEQRFRWVQTKNPNVAVYEDVVAAAVTKYTTADGYTNLNASYGGIYKFNSNTYYVMTNGTKGNWFGAIGAWGAWNEGIPGINGTAVKDGGHLDLYIRIDNVTFASSRTGCSLDKGGNGVLSPEFVEQ